MPRIPPLLSRKAAGIDRRLPRLLPVTRSLPGAENELRWIKQALPRTHWNEAVAQRSQHKPLQYILGDQPFGPLEIKCGSFALIPRWETEEWVLNVARCLKQTIVPDGSFKVVDFCTGTGCVALGIASEGSRGLQVVGVDVDERCVGLARENLSLNQYVLRNARAIEFIQQDLFQTDGSNDMALRNMRLLVSNPPYVTEEEYQKLDKSVRNYEPQLALIGNLEFYSALIRNVLIPNIETCDGFVFEVGSLGQIEYVSREVDKLGEWRTGYTKDSNDNYRCVVGWKQSGTLTSLQTLCAVVF